MRILSQLHVVARFDFRILIVFF